MQKYAQQEPGRNSANFADPSINNDPLIRTFISNSADAGVEHFRFALFPEGEAMRCFNRDPQRCFTTHFTSQQARESGSAAVILQTFADAVHPQFTTTIQNYVARHYQSCINGIEVGEAENYQSDLFQGKAPDGQWAWYQIRSRLTRGSDELILAEGVICDVTTTVELTQKAKSAEDHAQLILNSINNSVISVDQNLRITGANQAALAFLQQSEPSLEGQPLEQLISSQDNWLLRRLKDVLSGGEGGQLIDTELLLRHRTVTTNLAVLPLLQANKSQRGAMVMIDDITEEKRIKGTMARYMDPVIADELLRGGAEQLGGMDSEATVLFSDIRNFTSLTETLGAQKTVRFLNQYFTNMVECLQQEGGILDKFIGDAIMAVFGLPTPADHDADRAVRSAIAMQRRLEAFNGEHSQEGLPPLSIGIGIHTDVVVSGNIGSPKRMNYTVIGDGVNLAARLESACKFYGARLLISDSTARRLRGSYRMREADRVVMRGKTEPTKVHELLDCHSETSFPHPEAVLQHYRQGLALYRQQQWDGAMQAFQRALALHPHDRLSALYIERAQQLQANPPGPHWDGVWSWGEA